MGNGWRALLVSHLLGITRPVMGLAEVTQPSSQAHIIFIKIPGNDAILVRLAPPLCEQEESDLPSSNGIIPFFSQEAYNDLVVRETFQ